MRILYVLAALAGSAVLATAADQTEVAYVPHDKVDAALNNKADIYLVKADNLAVEGNYRNKPGVVELHEQLTDVFYITAGETTFVAGGGEYEGGKPTTPGQIGGGTITGGSYLSPGEGRRDRDPPPAFRTGSRKCPPRSATT